MEGKEARGKEHGEELQEGGKERGAWKEEQGRGHGKALHEGGKERGAWKRGAEGRQGEEERVKVLSFR